MKKYFKSLFKNDVATKCCIDPITNWDFFWPKSCQIDVSVNLKLKLISCSIVSKYSFELNILTKCKKCFKSLFKNDIVAKIYLFTWKMSNSTNCPFWDFLTNFFSICLFILRFALTGGKLRVGFVEHLSPT